MAELAGLNSLQRVGSPSACCGPCHQQTGPDPPRAGAKSLRARALRTFALFRRAAEEGECKGMITTIATSYESLLKLRKGAVDIVDVPEFGFASVTGTG